MMAVLLPFAANAQKIDVNLDNIRTAESLIQFECYQKLAGGINQWIHFRKPVDVDHQPTIAMNMDTFYSLAIVDLKKPVILTIPENDGRYFTVEIIDKDHYAYEVFTKPGKYILSEKDVGTRYVAFGVRVFMDPNNPDDLAEANALQDQFKIEAGSSETFVLPNYDMALYEALFNAIQQLVNFPSKDPIGAMAKRGEVDSLKHTVATIAGWGGLPSGNAMYQALQLN